MTKRQHKAMQRYVDSLLPKLGLKDWTVDVMKEPLPDDDALAECAKHYGRKDALISFRPDFFLCAPEFQRRVIVHELLHVCFAPEEAFVFDILGKHLPAKQHALVSDVYRHHHEFSVDGLAVAIAPLFPLPTLPR